PSRSPRRASAAWIWARATSSARSAARSASSSVRSSGSRAASAASASVTAWSFSCNANTASSPGCTSSPPRSDLVARVLHAQRVEHAPLLSQQLRLLFRRRQRDQPVQLGDLPLQAPRLDPGHRPLEQLVRPPAAQPLRLQPPPPPRRRP